MMVTIQSLSYFLSKKAGIIKYAVSLVTTRAKLPTSPFQICQKLPTSLNSVTRVMTHEFTDYFLANDQRHRTSDNTSRCSNFLLHSSQISNRESRYSSGNRGFTHRVGRWRAAIVTWVTIVTHVRYTTVTMRNTCVGSVCRPSVSRLGHYL